jgi:hypothetical protein
MTTIFRDGLPIPLGIPRLSVVTDELHTLSGIVSRFAREDRAPASDHVVLTPDVLEVVIALGNVPIITGLGILGAVLPGAGRSENARTAIAILEGLRTRRELVSILTEHRLYTNMVLSSLGFQNAAAFSGSVSLRARFEESPPATVETLFDPASLSSTGGGRTDKTASDLINAGRQKVQTAATADTRSFAARLLDGQAAKYGSSITP